MRPPASQKAPGAIGKNFFPSVVNSCFWTGRPLRNLTQGQVEENS